MLGVRKDLLNVLGLCAGIGGLELGLHLAEPRANPILFIEQDEFCQSVLKTRWPAAAIWSNVLTFDAKPWRRLIDVFTAGFPCQPWSTAGLQKGTEDDRWIWPRILDHIRDARPRYVFLENVPGLLVSGVGYVLADLAALGYDAVWGVFSCVQLGASHKRDRVFILAHCLEQQRQGQERRGLSGPVRLSEGLADASCLQFGRQQIAGPERPIQTQPGEHQSPLANSDCERLYGQPELHGRNPETHRPSEAAMAHGDSQQWGALWERRFEIGRRSGPVVDSLRSGERSEEFDGPLDANLSPGETLADADGNRCRENLRRPGFPRDGFSWPPGPEGSWECIPRELWPAQPKVRPVADGVPRRVDPDRRKRLRALGNAVSPPVAAVAWRVLKERLLG